MGQGRGRPVRLEACRSEMSPSLSYQPNFSHQSKNADFLVNRTFRMGFQGILTEEALIQGGLVNKSPSGRASGRKVK